MALFKILQGNSGSHFTHGSVKKSELTEQTFTPPFRDGYCYFVKDKQLFYIDFYETIDNVEMASRKPLNAEKAETSVQFIHWDGEA